MKICGIYKITSPSKKIYVGQSIDIMKRWNTYNLLHCSGQTSLYHSLKKHGVDKHKFEIICQCSRSELNNLEVYYIELYQCFNSKFGLNLRAGGNAFGVSDETREKLSQKGDKNGFFGKKHTEESLSKMRSYHRNRPIEVRNKIGSAHKGKVISMETRKKTGNSVRGEKNGMYGKTHTEETRRFLRKINLNPSLEKRKMLSSLHDHEKKPVCQIDKKDNKLIRMWESIRAASKGLDIDTSQIGQCCINKKGYVTAGGFRWEFFDGNKFNS